jgi:hypothetical protein
MNGGWKGPAPEEEWKWQSGQVAKWQSDKVRGDGAWKGSAPEEEGTGHRALGIRGREASEARGVVIVRRADRGWGRA